MAQTASIQSPPSSLIKRPKGILKNSNSYQYTSPDARVSPTSEQEPSFSNHDGQTDGGRPPMAPRQLSEKEITQMNTEANAGGHRHNSSNSRGSISRRHSSQNGDAGEPHYEGEVRLKWDEANLYVNESQMGGKMKIDEPKTPFARNYDPAEDEEEIANINAEELAVDELDMSKQRPRGRKTSGSGARESEIPDIDLGEPEMDPRSRRDSDGERRVTVDKQADTDAGHHGEENESDMSHEELAKHRKFEEMRKKHYEMKNIKNLLGHPEKIDALADEDDDDDDDEMNS